MLSQDLHNPPRGGTRRFRAWLPAVVALSTLSGPCVGIRPLIGQAGAGRPFSAGAPQAGTLEAAAAAGMPCSAQFDPLKATRALLAQCGIGVYPREVPAAGAPGSHLYNYNIYDYDVDGVSVTYKQPLATFDPLTAPTRELATFGVPAEPARGEARQAWRREMAGLHFVPAPPFLVEVAAHAASSTPDYSDHWAGYVAYGGPFARAASTWVEPRLLPTRCRWTSLTIWSGIGGYSSGSLAQDGTAEGTPELGRDQAWWELTPAGMVPVPLYASEGASFTAQVSYLGKGRFSFFMENDRTHAAWAGIEHSSNGASLATAESIVERPCLWECTTGDARYANLSNFRKVLFQSSLIDGKPMGSVDTYQEHMSTTGIAYAGDLAYPSTFSPNKASFTVSQRSCR